MDDQQQPVMQLDDNFLNQLGLGELSPEAKESLLQHAREELQLRIGLALAENLSDEQLDEFEQLMGGGADQQAASEWLSQNCPGYQDVVMGETEKMRNELSQNREAILSGTLPDAE